MAHERERLPPWPERFNLCQYFLDRNLEEGRGDKAALRVGSEGRSFAELCARVCRLAAWMRRAGLRPEERVLLALSDGFEFAEAFFAVLRAGGVFAMVNPLQKRDALAYALGYTKARILVADAAVLEELGDPRAASRFLDEVLVVGGGGGGGLGALEYESALAGHDPDEDGASLEPTGPDDLAGWLFTSGSTGEPKACVHTHGDFAYSTETYALRVVRYHEQDVCLSVPKLFFGYATGTNLMFPFRVGAAVVLFPERATAEVLLDHIERHRPTLLTGVPTILGNMLRSERMQAADLSSLRVVLSAGEALPPELYKSWKGRTGVEILDGIGSAEMFHIYISNRLDDVRPGTLGKLVPGYDAEIVDEAGRPVPSGSPGRLRVRGGSTALCYWGDKAKSTATFQGEWCTTADVFRRDDEGYFHYEGRDDDLLKVSGIWVSPLEIENALLGHPAVAEVCVVGRPDSDGLVKPLALVVVTSGFVADDRLAADLKAHVKERLAPYKYPRWFEWRSQLPKNDRGKLARKQLKDEVASRVGGEAR